MQLEQKLKDIIGGEDKRNPYTDEVLAQELAVSREAVTILRNELKIKDSRDRRKEQILLDIRQCLLKYGHISDRKMTGILQEMGYQIGRYAVTGYRQEAEAGFDIPEVAQGDAKTESLPLEEKTVFSQFVGYDGSLANEVRRAKAAVMYPPKGLHTLILGPSGVGKSFLAELMYQYAVKTENFTPDAPFYEFNCADYAENPQLLMAQLFGYAKGAFTGATDNKKGVIEQCDGGILFLDEVHRLPPEGQELLFYLMDKGKYRRLGEVDAMRECRLMVIAATTEEPSGSLLLTFRRRIPMTIEIPPVKERPLEEKMQLISMCFLNESRRISRELQVKAEVINCLLGCEFPGNVGQLRSDIQVCCAKGFLENKIHPHNDFVITQECLSENLSQSYANDRSAMMEKGKIHRDMFFSYAENKIYSKAEEIDEHNIYDEIDEKYRELTADGVAAERIGTLLSREIEEEFLKYIQKVEESEYSFDEIENIVGKDVLEITKKVYELVKESIPSVGSSLIFPLALHINTAIQRAKRKKKADTPAITNIETANPIEFAAAQKAVLFMNMQYHLNIPRDEVNFIAMYLKKFQETKKTGDDKITVLIVSHGHVACGMADVANRILGVRHAVGLEMDLREPFSVMEKRILQELETRNNDKGCIVLADMGSFLQLEEKLWEKMHIRARVIERCDTLMAIECIRKVLWTDESMESIAQELDVKNLKENSGKVKIKKKKGKAILCLCITGEGAAAQIKEHLQNRLKSNLGNVSILTRGYLENQEVEDTIQEVEQDYEVLVLIGTIHPGAVSQCFIPVAEAYKPEGIAKIRAILKKAARFENNVLSEVIHPENIKICSNTQSKYEILDLSVRSMEESKSVKEGFLLSVYKREGLMTTYLSGGIAIPHGETEQVTKSTISVTKLDKPVVWDGVNVVDLVFLLALDENSKKYFEQLYSIISDEQVVSDIRNCLSEQEIYDILCKNTKSDK